MNKNILFLGSAILIFALIGVAQAFDANIHLEQQFVQQDLNAQEIDFGQTVRGTWQVSPNVDYYLCKNGVQNSLDSNCWIVPYTGHLQLTVDSFTGNCNWFGEIGGTTKVLSIGITDFNGVSQNQQFAFKFKTQNLDVNCGLIASSLRIWH